METNANMNEHNRVFWYSASWKILEYHLRNGHHWTFAAGNGSLGNSNQICYWEQLEKLDKILLKCLYL